MGTIILNYPCKNCRRTSRGIFPKGSNKSVCEICFDRNPCKVCPFDVQCEQCEFDPMKKLKLLFENYHKENIT